MNNKKYNGFTNYQTWNFKTWMTSDENDYKAISKKIELAIIKSNEKGYTQSHKYFKASKLLEEYALEWVDNVVSSKASFVNDVLRYAINGINFYEIAEHLVDEVEKEMEVA